jgi:hypothetical protein
MGFFAVCVAAAAEKRSAAQEAERMMKEILLLKIFRVDMTNTSYERMKAEE